MAFRFVAFQPTLAQRARRILADWQSRIRFEPNGHRYSVLVGDQWVIRPSVTTILQGLNKPALVDWSARVQQEADIRVAFDEVYGGQVSGGLTFDQFAAHFRAKAGKEKEHAKVLRRASDHGTQLHSLIEQHVRVELGLGPKPPEAGEIALRAFAAWLEWYRDSRIRPVAVEKRVFSATFDYCGSVDFLGVREGRLIQTDWKSSKGIWPEMRLQQVAYAHALQEMGIDNDGEPIRKVLVKIPKLDRPIVEEYKVPDGHAALRAFAALREVYRWTNAEVTE